LLAWSLVTLSRHEAALRQSERRLMDTLESITDGFVTLDADWRYVYVNEEAARLMQKSRVDLLGKIVWQIFPESVGGTAHTELHRAAAARISVEFEDFNPVMQRWFANRAYPTADGGMSVYFQDVTLRKRAEQLANQNQRTFVEI